MVQAEFQGEGWHGEEEDSMPCCGASLAYLPANHSKALLASPSGLLIWNNVCVSALKIDEGQSPWYRAELIITPLSLKETLELYVPALAFGLMLAQPWWICSTLVLRNTSVLIWVSPQLITIACYENRENSSQQQ